MLSLQKWSVCFGPRLKAATKQPVWVKLPRLPLKLWSDKILNYIGDCLKEPLLLMAPINIVHLGLLHACWSNWISRKKYCM